MDYELNISEFIRELRQIVYHYLSIEFDLKFEEFVNLINLNKTSVDLNRISKIKDKFTKNMVCNKDIPRLYNISDDKLMITEVNQFLINKYLRLIVRKEFKQFESIRCLSTFFRPCNNYKEVAVFFYIISKFLIINKLKFDLFKPKDLSDFSIFIVYDYIIRNTDIKKIEINSDISFEIQKILIPSKIYFKSFSIFDVIYFKPNLETLTVNIRNYSLKLVELNRILKKLNLKSLILKDLFEIKYETDNDWEEFFNILLNHNKLKKFVFNYSYKYNFNKKITFSKNILQQLLSFYCTLVQMNHFEVSDISNNITQEFINSIKNRSNIINKNIKSSRLILIISFIQIASFNFINFRSLIELNIGPLDFFSFKYLTCNLNGNNFKKVIIRLKDDKIVINMENYLEYLKFLTQNSFYCDRFELLGYSFNDEVLIALKQMLILNSTIKFTVISFFLEYVKPDEDCVREYNSELYYYSYDIPKILNLLFAFKFTTYKLRILRNKQRILKIIFDYYIRRHPTVVYLFNLTDINLVVNYNKQ